MSDSYLLQFSDISKSFGGIQALSGVTENVHKGEILGIIGPNGAGKSTLMNCITGLYRPDGGKVTFDSKNITGHSPESVSRIGITRTFQTPRPFKQLTVYQNVYLSTLYSKRRKGDPKEKAQSLIKFVGLGDKISNEAKGLSVPELRKLELARALAGDPLLLMLDEVSAGLDEKEIDDVVQLIKNINQTGVSVIVIEHNVKLIMNLVTRIVVLNFGKVLAAGSAAQIASDKRVIEAYLGEEYVKH